MTRTQQNIYIQRVNCVLDYVSTHLDDDLSLAKLAAIAGFSEFHFHRIFKAIVGETLNQFIWRVRVERGAVLLRADHTMRVSDVAVTCGFTSLAGFSRAFKKRFGIVPTQWDRQTPLQRDNNSATYRVSELERTGCQIFPVYLRQMPAQRLAYIRVHDAYSDPVRIEVAYARLLRWYQHRGGHLGQTTLYGMSQDDPDVTPRERCRFDWCLQVPGDWDGDAEISIRDFPECMLAVIAITGDIEVEAQAQQYFWRCWLPRSAYQPRNLPAMEIYRRYPHQTGWWDTFYLDCAVPVTRLV